MRTTLKERKTNEEVFKTIFTKWNKNASFKKQFIERPIETLEEEVGKKMNLPEWKKKLIVEDQSDTSIIYLNIPANEELDFEMTEKEMEMVSGGVLCGGACVATGIVFLASVAIGWLATD